MKLAMALMAVMLGSVSVRGDTINSTWNGGTGNWSSPSNWNNGVPSSNDNAIVGNGSGPFPVVNVDINATANNLTLDSGGLLIAPGKSLATQSNPNLTQGINMTGSGSFIVGATGTETLSGGTLSGHGTISNVGLSFFNITADGGTLTIRPNSQVLGSAEMNVKSGSTLDTTGGRLESGDLLHVQGTLKLNDSVNINTLLSDTTFILDGPAVRVVNQSNVDVLAKVSDIFNGNFTITNGATLSTKGSLDNNGFGNDVFLVSHGSTLAVNGNFTTCCFATVSGSRMTVNGTWFANPAEPESISLGSGAILKVRGDFENNGSLGSVDLSGGSTLTVLKNFNTSGEVILTTGSAALVQGTFTNSGDVEFPPGVQIDNSSVLTAKSGYIQTAGNTFGGAPSSTVVDGLLNAHGSGVNIQGGTLSGTGVVNGNTIMAGTMMPGDPPFGVSPLTGVFTIKGNYTQTSTGTLLEQVGLLNGSNTTLLQVLGLADLNGTLDIALQKGFKPSLGETFVLMTCGSCDGTFASVNGLEPGKGIGFDLFYDAHDVRLVAESAPVATPEPSSFLLLGLGLLGLTTFSRLRHRARLANVPR